MTEPGNGPKAQDELARALGPLYVPPAASEYWDLLHTRIMARILSAGDAPGPSRS